MTDRPYSSNEADAAPKQHYSPDEANAILESAVREKALPGDVSREQLEALAAEMGITPAELSAAELRYQSEREIEELRPRFRAERRWRLTALFLVSLFCVAVPALSGEASAREIAQVAITFLTITLIALARMTFGGEDAAFQRWLDRRGRRMLRDSRRDSRRQPWRGRWRY